MWWRRWSGPVLLLLTVSACGRLPERGRAPVLPPESQFVDAGDQTLANGVVGEPYQGVVVADGGVAPYLWVPVDPLPVGLQLSPDGTIAGIPKEAGTSTFALSVSDAEGRAKRMLATFTATLVPRTVRCGGHLEGRFERSVGETRPDLSLVEDLEWLALELPHDETTRVELVLESSGTVVAWMQQAGELPLGSWDLDGYASRSVTAETSPKRVRVDAGTDPSLTSYATQSLLPLLLTPKEPSDWSLDVVCTDGPVFETLDKYPKRVGEWMEVDYQVFGDNEGVRIWTDDPLPDWMTWDESTGLVTGTAPEVGAWEFTIHARAPDGREREELALLGVYETTDLGCDQSAPVVVTQAWEEGEQTKRYDPRGFHTFRLPLPPPEVSGIQIEVTGADRHYLGLARPNPGWQRYFAHVEEKDTAGTTRIRVDSTSYPASRHYLDAGELYFTAGSTTEGDVDGIQVQVSCDFDPVPDVRGLPVLEILEEVDLQLGGIGGTPPYRWAAEGLPPGMSMDAAGHVTGSAGVAGTHRVTFTLTDSVGGVGEQRLDWTIGGENACLGFRELACDEASGTRELPDAWEDVLPGEESDARDTYCIRDTTVDLGLVVYADEGSNVVLSLADPGVSRKGDVFVSGNTTLVAEVEENQVVGVPFDSYSFPSRLDYVRRPLFATIWSVDPGTYSLEVDCP